MATKAAKVSGKQVLAEMERYINHMVANHRKPESITLQDVNSGEYRCSSLPCCVRISGGVVCQVIHEDSFRAFLPGNQPPGATGSAGVRGARRCLHRQSQWPTWGYRPVRDRSGRNRTNAASQRIDVSLSIRIEATAQENDEHLELRVNPQRRSRESAVSKSRFTE